MAGGTGTKTGGRRAGVKNKRTVETEKRLEELGCDPLELMALRALDAVPCNKCEDNGGGIGMVTPIQAYYLRSSGWSSEKEKRKAESKTIDGKLEVCPDCAGYMVQRLTPELVAKCIESLLNRVAPKLASKTVDKQIRRTSLLRMNSMSRMEREAVEKVLADAKKRDEAND